MSVSGLQQMVAFCREHGIAHEQCGKIVVATEESELPRLENLWERGNANGLQGLRKLNAGANQGNRTARRRHRGDSRAAGRHRGLSGRLRKTRRTHPQKRRRNPAQRARPKNGFGSGGLDARNFRRKFPGRNLSSPAAGCMPTGWCGRQAKSRRPKSFRFAANIFQIKKERQFLVRNLIYPVPDPKFPFLGVHFTRLDSRRHRGRAERRARLCARRLPMVGRQSCAIWRNRFAYPGLWRFLAKYPSMCGYEIRRSLSKRRIQPLAAKDSCRKFARMIWKPAAPACAPRR